jgi:hypothetical protein
MSLSLPENLREETPMSNLLVQLPDFILIICPVLKVDHQLVEHLRLVRRPYLRYFLCLQYT